MRYVEHTIHFDESYTTFTFRDGMTVDLTTCPRASMAREHWRNDGTCHCRRKAS